MVVQRQDVGGGIPWWRWRGHLGCGALLAGSSQRCARSSPPAIHPVCGKPSAVPVLLHCLPSQTVSHVHSMYLNVLMLCPECFLLTELAHGYMSKCKSTTSLRRSELNGKQQARYQDTDLHGHDTHPSKLGARAIVGSHVPEQHQAQGIEDHQHSAEPQLPRTTHRDCGSAHPVCSMPKP